MQPLVLAGLGLDPRLANTLSKPLAWVAVAGVVFLLLRSSLVPAGIKLVVTVVVFIAAVGWAGHAGILEVVTGHSVEDADKLLIAVVGTFALWLAFLRGERPQRPSRTEETSLARMLAGRGRR